MLQVRMPTGGMLAAHMGAIGGPWQEVKFIDHCGAKIEFGKAGEVEDITKKVKGIVSCEFLEEKSLAVYNPE